MIANTVSQRWANSHGACFVGRRALDTRSIGEYWRTTNNVDHLVWIARRLDLPGTSSTEQLIAYREAVERCRTYGRWGATQTRRKLLALFEAYSVYIPARLL